MCRLLQYGKLSAHKVKPKPEKPDKGLRLDMDFDEAMRRALRVKPAKKPKKKK
jgi:hypothetical protein